tara:strand:+ start:208 stop:405 length:198 start_codon:yes stop_codon:yes gene_type:complete
MKRRKTMKALFTIIALTFAVNVSFAAELGEGSADCSSMVQSNRATSATVASTSSAEVEVSESSER